MIHKDDQSLAQFQREFDAEDPLYKQGDMGNTMFIVTQGTVALYRTTHGVERLVGTIGPGEMLGEKALLSKGAYRRTLTATAKTKVVVIEFNAANLKIIQKRLPDFTMSIIRVLSERLDEANELISLLRSPNEVESVIEYLVFATRHHSTRLPTGGNQLLVSPQDMSVAVNVPQETVEQVISNLISNRALVKRDGALIVTDIPALESQISDVKANVAA